MPTSVEFRVPKILYVVTRLTAPQACEAASAWAWAMLIALLFAILPWQVLAETTSPALSALPEAAPGFLRQGIVTITSNLRVSPSIHSEIVAVAKEGTRVKILLESGRWLQVRSDEAVEAWIYKPLVLIEQESIQSSSEAPVSVAPVGPRGNCPRSGCHTRCFGRISTAEHSGGAGVRGLFTGTYQRIARPTPSDLDCLGS